MGKIYKRVGGYISKLTQINNGGNPGTGSEGWSSASLIYKSNGGRQRANSIRSKKYNGIDYINGYIKNNLLIIDLQIGGQPGGGLLFLTAINPKPVTLKVTREYLLKLTSVHVNKLIE